MRFFSSVVVLGSLASSVIGTTVAPRSTSADLESWIKSAIAGFFPNHDGWEDSFDTTFSTNLTATFGEASYDYAGLKGYFTVANTAIQAYFGAPGTAYAINFTTVVGVPNANDDGGQVYITGIEGGLQADGTENYATDAAYGVIAIEDGQKKIVEWRESTNFKFPTA